MSLKSDLDIQQTGVCLHAEVSNLCRSVHFSVTVTDVIWCEMDSSFIVAFCDGVAYLANKESVIMAFEKQLVRFRARWRTGGIQSILFLFIAQEPIFLHFLPYAFNVID